LGHTTNQTIQRKEYIPTIQIISHLQEVLSQEKKIDYLTFSGSGEPTLNSKIGKIILEIKKMSKIPVAVLTNSTLFSDTKVRSELLSADLVVPSLDAVTQETFAKVNYPYRSLKVGEIVEGLKKFRKVYKGKIWLEIMLVKGVNDNQEELLALKKVIEEINPDKIQLNTPVRPPAESWVKALSPEEMEKIRKFFGEKTEVITEFGKKGKKVYEKGKERELLSLIARRPVTLEEISSLGIPKNEVIKYLQSLQERGTVVSKNYQNKTYFQKTENRGTVISNQ